MGKNNYDPNYIAQYYDADPEREWQRLVRAPSEEIKLHIHNHYLRKHITPGSRVLEIGAGPGRFTQTLHELHCRIVVSDISTGQLAANQAKAAELGFAASVDQWVQADICAMSQFQSDSFDAVVAYGGPLSYVFEEAGVATRECWRLLKPEGVFLLSVMSLWGTLHKFFVSAMELPIANNQAIIQTGNLTPTTEPGNRHPCHMFRADELRALLTDNGFDLIALSASNSISANHGEALERIRTDPELWSALLAFEIEASASPGYVEAGTHLIAAAGKMPNP